MFNLYVWRTFIWFFNSILLPLCIYTKHKCFLTTQPTTSFCLDDGVPVEITTLHVQYHCELFFAHLAVWANCSPEQVKNFLLSVVVLSPPTLFLVVAVVLVVSGEQFAQVSNLLRWANCSGIFVHGTNFFVSKNSLKTTKLPFHFLLLLPLPSVQSCTEENNTVDESIL